MVEPRKTVFEGEKFVNDMIDNDVLSDVVVASDVQTSPSSFAYCRKGKEIVIKLKE